MTNYTLNLKPFMERISDRNLQQLCRENPDLRFEIDAEGNLIIMSPIGSESGKRNGDLFLQVGLWNRQTKLGVLFDSSTGFKLSNDAVRSPDVSWIAIKRWNSLTKEQQQKLAPIDPDFIIELLSPTDNLKVLQQKMNEYISCGVKLGWLIDPDRKQVEIYRLGKDKKVLDNPRYLEDNDILPGLTLDLFEIF